MFVAQTVLIRYASRAQNGNVTILNPPQETARFDGMVPDVATAMSYLPAAQRPAADQWGGYGVRHDGRYVYTTTIAGTHSAAPNLLVVFYDVWASEAARLANPANPPYRNTHTIGLDPGLSAADLRARVRAIVEETVVRHSVEGRAGDMRDTRLVATQTDPAGVLNKAQPLNGTTVAIAPPASAAPLYTMTPK
jgi:hypothetical protein